VDERSEVFNHFVTALPTEARDPNVVEKFVQDVQIGLRLTAESVASLLGRPAPPSEDEAPPAAEPTDETSDDETSDDAKLL
jgi:hypothetical protein